MLSLASADPGLSIGIREVTCDMFMQSVVAVVLLAWKSGGGSV